MQKISTFRYINVTLNKVGGGERRQKFRSFTVKLSVKLLGVKFKSRRGKAALYSRFGALTGALTVSSMVAPEQIAASGASWTALVFRGLLSPPAQGAQQPEVQANRRFGFFRHSSRLLPSLVSDSTPCATKVKEPDNGASPRPPCCPFGRSLN